MKRAIPPMKRAVFIDKRAELSPPEEEDDEEEQTLGKTLAAMAKRKAGK